MGDQATTNGTSPSSQFLSHLISYPLVSQSIFTLKKSPYAQKPLEYADKSYSQIEPIIPYLAGPYSYVAPYVEKADQLGNEGLNRVDDTSSKLLKATEDLRGTVQCYIQAAGESSHYVRSTYDSEIKQAEGGPVVSHGRAAVSTGLMVTSNYLLWLSNLLVPHKDKAQGNVNGSAKPPVTSN